MPSWLSLLVGLVVLTGGAELLVRGAAWIAEALGVRHMIVGLTVVAIGTSAPELVVSLIAAFEDRADFVLGNVYGSNIANLALIMGIAALIQPVQAGESRIRFELVWLLFASFLTLVPFFTGSFDQMLGSFMVMLIVLFLYWVVKRERHVHPQRTAPPPSNRSASQFLLHGVLVLLGLTGLILGGDWLVDGAVRIAEQIGLSDAVIAATIVAVGTSLPELATSILAARKGHPELALGNIIGSNIFNILMVIGVTAIVIPLPASWEAQGLRTMTSFILTGFMAILLLGPRHLSRVTGGFLLTCYLAYLVTEVIRL